MTKENKYREFLVNFAEIFASKTIDDEWCGIDIDLGSLEDEFRDAELFLKQIAIDANREGYEECEKICEEVAHSYNGLPDQVVIDTLTCFKIAHIIRNKKELL